MNLEQISPYVLGSVPVSAWRVLAPSCGLTTSVCTQTRMRVYTRAQVCVCVHAHYTMGLTMTGCCFVAKAEWTAQSVCVY